MRARLTRSRLRDTVLFALVGAIVSVLGCEVDTRQQADRVAREDDRAKADMSVIASVERRGTVLKAGERYSLTRNDTSLILTIPADFDLEFWGYPSEEGDGNDFSYSWVGAHLRYEEGDVWAGIDITVELTGGGDFDPWSCPGEEGSRHVSESADESQARRINAAFDELVERMQVLSIDSNTYAPCLAAD